MHQSRPGKKRKAESATESAPKSTTETATETATETVMESKAVAPDTSDTVEVLRWLADLGWNTTIKKLETKQQQEFLWAIFDLFECHRGCEDNGRHYYYSTECRKDFKDLEAAIDVKEDVGDSRLKALLKFMKKQLHD